MSEGMNKVLLLGNLGADPELRRSPSGTAVLQLRLATSETWVDKNRQVQARTEWHNVVVWGPRAEGLAKVLRKGSSVLVEGGLRTTSFERDGTKRSKTEVLARELFLTGARVQADATQTARAQRPSPLEATPPAAALEPLPF